MRGFNVTASFQVRDVDGVVHPGLLHITPGERKKREKKTGKKRKEVRYTSFAFRCIDPNLVPIL